MNKALLGLAAIAMAGSATAARAAAPILHETKMVVIAAPPMKVWAMIQNFGDMTWVPPVKSTTATMGNTPGSVRTLDLGGPKLMEQLKSYDAHEMTYTYIITDNPANKKTLPVSDYTSTISVKPSQGGSMVTWTGSFKRADPAETPASGMDDSSATTAVTGVYDAGLGGLKSKATAN